MNTLDHRFCVAPMMDWTDRHDRMFLRQFSRHALLYTEMVTAAALRHGDADYLLAHNPVEQPVALQLGGSDPDELMAAAVLGAGAGYREINFNVGCPSDRVQSGRFGACLMAEPELVAKCVTAMAAAVSVPVTVKCRIGIDEQDNEAFLFQFIEQIATSGCKTFIIHARKAILSGLSPKQNREIPPLNYERVIAAKAHFPELEIIINGGIDSLVQARTFLQAVDGVMLGREAYQNPYLLHQVDSEIFGETAADRTRQQYLEQFLPYVEQELARGTPLHHITRHTLGLFRGVKGGRQYRRHLSQHACDPGAGIAVLRDALNFVAG
ncbi:MAG: tRNA dihydrouridine(20/20a) synthase DusA [Pseudohongiellaceae bacterium]